MSAQDRHETAGWVFLFLASVSAFVLCLFGLISLGHWLFS